jgi:hypothetical protein
VRRSGTGGTGGVWEEGTDEGRRVRMRGGGPGLGKTGRHRRGPAGRNRIGRGITSGKGEERRNGGLGFRCANYYFAPGRGPSFAMGAAQVSLWARPMFPLAIGFPFLQPVGG